MTEGGADVLVIGYGNPARLDDGLGPAFAAALEKASPTGVTVQADYQLTVEDAADVARHATVVFADADVGGPEPFCFRQVMPKGTLGLTSHDVQPQAVLALAHELFDAGTTGYTLAIRGYDFGDFGERLSARAQANLDAAVEFFLRVLTDRTFHEAQTRLPARTAAGAADG